MTAEQKAAFIVAQVACANVRVAAMQAENLHYLHQGQPPRYGEADFDAVPDQFVIGHNAVISFFAHG